MWTGRTVEIQMRFSREKHARWARHVAEEMIRLLLAQGMPEQYPWVREAEALPSLSARYLAFRQDCAKMQLQRDPALGRVERFRRRLSLTGLDPLMATASFDNAEDLFPQLCFACALRFPQVPFSARFRYEMTVSGSIQLLRVQYDGERMRVQQKLGERPFDENDWTGVPVCDYSAADGVFRKEAKE